MKDYILKPGTFIAKSTVDKTADIPGLSLEKYIVSVLNGETCCIKNIVGDSLIIGEPTPVSSSAIVQINSTTQGFLFPRMTTAQRNAVVSPAVGLIIYNTTDLVLNQWNGTEWTEVGSGGLSLLNDALMTTTLTQVVDKDNTASALLLSTKRIGLISDSTVTTQTTAVIEATTTNSGIAIVPNGTGAITRKIPNGSTGGNLRGNYATDFAVNESHLPENVASGNYSFAAGNSSKASGLGSVAFGSNRVYATNTGSVAMGTQSRATGLYSLAIGINQIASNRGSVALGGYNNGNTSSGFSTFVAGDLNTASSGYSVVSGGESNTASTGTHATVIGGFQNTSSGEYSISGGSTNTASGLRSVAFGFNSQASGIGGVAFAGGRASGGNSFAVGNQNTASGGSSIAFGIFNNTASGSSSVVIGHKGAIASQEFSYALGGVTNSYLRGMFAFSNINDDIIITKLQQQWSNLLAFKADTLTTGATTILSLDGTGTTNLIIPFGNNRIWNVKVSTVAVVTVITGTATGVSVGDSFMENRNLLFKRVGGTSSIVGVGTAEIIADTSMLTALMTYTAGASQELALTFNGATFAGGGSLTIRVVSKVELVEVAY
jgi:hypothetical protein